MATDRSRATETADLADALFTLMPLVAEHVNERLAELGMTTTDWWALRSVDGPMPMKDLAQCMDVDRSSVTLVADRLEELGLIERQPHPTDRRVKNLVLTAEGRRLKETIPEMLWSGSNTFSPLTGGERRAMIDLVRGLVARQPDADDPVVEPPAMA
ncbi:MAG: MarR family transcriptional regulator [Actinomycetota bacterium]